MDNIEFLEAQEKAKVIQLRRRIQYAQTRYEVDTRRMVACLKWMNMGRPVQTAFSFAVGNKWYTGKATCVTQFMTITSRTYGVVDSFPLAEVLG
jgi:hypothetical protein